MQIIYLKQFTFTEIQIATNPGWLRILKNFNLGEKIYKIIMLPKVFIVLSTQYFQITDTKKISEKAGLISPFYNRRGGGER